MVNLCLKHVWNHKGQLSLNFLLQIPSHCPLHLMASFCYHDQYLHKLCLRQSKYVVPRPVFPLLTMLLSLLHDFLLENNTIAVTVKITKQSLVILPANFLTLNVISLIPHFLHVYLVTIVHHLACRSIPLNLLAKTTRILFIVRTFLLLFYTTLTLYLVFCIFLGGLTLCVKTYYTAIIVYHLSFLGKFFQ